MPPFLLCSLDSQRSPGAQQVASSPEAELESANPSAASRNIPPSTSRHCSYYASRHMDICKEAPTKPRSGTGSSHS